MGTLEILEFMAEDIITSGVSNIFGKVQGFFGKFFDKEGESVLGIDIGSSSIKIVQMKKKGGKAVLETYGELALGPYAGFSIGQATSLPEEKISEALTDILREANTTTKNSGIAVPLSASLVIVINMPTVSGAKLGDMVLIEARRYIPVPISEVSLDWKVIPEDKLSSVPAGASASLNGEVENKDIKNATKANTRILIAVVHNETLNKYQRIARKNSLDVSFLEIETFSSARSVLVRSSGTILILDIGSGTTKFSIIENGVVTNTHIINRGSQDITIALSKSLNIDIQKAEAVKREVGLLGGIEHQGTSDTVNLVLRNIFTEVQKMILDYEKKQHKIIDKVVLSGGGSLLKGILEYAQKSFNTEVVYANPFSKIDSPAFLENVLQGVGPNFAVAIGIGLRKLQELE